MKTPHILGTLTLLFSLTNAGAAEITSCILDSAIKTNPRVYFFPITASALRCDHVTDSTSVTLGELYQQNWRLLQVVNPVEFKQKDNATAYTPVLLYLERTQRPPEKPRQKEVSTTSSYNNDDIDTESSSEESSSKNSGGLFGTWFKGDTQEETESE